MPLQVLFKLSYRYKVRLNVCMKVTTDVVCLAVMFALLPANLEQLLLSCLDKLCG